MTDLEELYYTLGRLESLKTTNSVQKSDIAFLKEFLCNNLYFNKAGLKKESKTNSNVTIKTKSRFRADNTPNDVDYCRDTFDALSDGEYDYVSSESAYFMD